MKTYSFIFALLQFLMTNTVAYALELPKAGIFEIKKVNDLKILYVHHKKSNGHISNSLIRLVQYYLLEEDEGYEVIFPQFSMDSYNIDGSYYAIGYNGNPIETHEVKMTTLRGGLFASYIYKGSYKTIDKAIRTAFQKALKTGKYVPHDKEEIRLLYWNSIDDNHPKDLITEIQVRVRKLP